MLETVEKFEKNISECKAEPGFITDLIVAVITVCGSLSTRINIQNLVQCYEPNKEFEMIYVPNSRKTKTFYNCLSVKFLFTDSSGVTSRIIAKVFPNGSISVPGCRTIQAVHEAPVKLAEYIRKISSANADVADPEKLVLANVKIVMINSNFMFNRIINQELLKDRMNSCTEITMWRTANFQPEKYSGVNIRFLTRAGLATARAFIAANSKVPFKMAGQLSIFMFRSGKCTITGAKCTDDILEAFKSIVEFIRLNHDLSLIKPCIQ